MVLLIHALRMMEFPHPAVSSILPHLFLQLQRTPLLQNHACSLPFLTEECSATSDGNGETLSFRTPGQPARWLSGQLQHMVILWAIAHLCVPWVPMGCHRLLPKSSTWRDAKVHYCAVITVVVKFCLIGGMIHLCIPVPSTITTTLGLISKDS